MKFATKNSPEAGLTLVEIMFAVVLVAAFFASVFELNAVCLRYVDATKESIAALQSVREVRQALAHGRRVPRRDVMAAYEHRLD